MSFSLEVQLQVRDLQGLSRKERCETTMKNSERESNLEGVVVLVVVVVEVLHPQEVVGFLHQKEEVVALQKGVLEQVEQPVQAVVLGVGVLMVQEGEVVQVLGVLVVLAVREEELVLVLQERFV